MRGFDAASVGGGGWSGGGEARNEGLAKDGNGNFGFQDRFLVILELE